MKNNILIIVLVTVVALGVITTVILASVINSDDPQDKSSQPAQSSSSYSQDVTPSGTNQDSSWSAPPDSVLPSSPSGPSNVEGIVATANSLIGVPFLDNGSSPDGFDNSGFIYYVLRENGFITCPRTLDGQAKMGARLEFSELKVGDLVFFVSEPGDEAAGFGGIYIGGGKMIACLMPGTDVREVDISGGYYSARFFCGISLS